METGYIDTDKMYNIAMKWQWGNSGSPDIYHDQQTIRYSRSYRRNLGLLEEQLLEEGKIEKVVNIANLVMKNLPPEYYSLYFVYEPFINGYYKAGDKKTARKILIQLIGKYKEKMEYYKSLPYESQNIKYESIIREIEQYRGLLLVMKDNNDTELYNTSKADFNRLNKGFRQFERKNEE